MISRLDDMVAQMYAYYLNNHSLIETGKRFHRSEQGVLQLFKRRGMKRREAHRKIKRSK